MLNTHENPQWTTSKPFVATTKIVYMRSYSSKGVLLRTDVFFAFNIYDDSKHLIFNLMSFVTQSNTSFFNITVYK